MSSILETFGELPVNITKDHIVQMERFIIHFLIRKTNPLTLNGMTLGVHPIAFTTADRNTLFDIFEIREKDVELVIRKTHSIDRNFMVTSDPYNLLIFWLCHLSPIYIKDKNVCYTFQSSLIKAFLLRVFCSVSNNSFRHGSNEGICNATIASLSKKSDIIRLGSWNALIDSHVAKVLDPEDRFYQTIVDGAPDDMFLRAIAENQTALRSKIVTFAVAYYEAHAQGNSINSRSSISQNDEGEKIVAQTASVIESATQASISEILNPNMFIHDISIDDVANLFKNTLSSRMIKTALLKMNQTAVLQSSSRDFDKVEITKEGTVYIGVRVLMIEIIRSTIRICREKRVNMGNRALVFETMRNTYSSSRSLDPDVIAIKKSVGLLVDSFNITVNPASQSALRLAVIFYILYRCITKMK